MPLSQLKKLLNCTIRAINGEITFAIPIVALYDSVPLCFCSVKIDSCQAAATRERITANDCDTVGNCDACQAAAIRERTFV